MELPELCGAEVGALSKDLDALLERLERLLAGRGDRLSEDELGAELPGLGDVELLGDISVDLGKKESVSTARRRDGKETHKGVVVLERGSEALGGERSPDREGVDTVSVFGPLPASICLVSDPTEA